MTKHVQARPDAQAEIERLESINDALDWSARAVRRCLEVLAALQRGESFDPVAIELERTSALIALRVLSRMRDVVAVAKVQAKAAGKPIH